MTGGKVVSNYALHDLKTIWNLVVPKKKHAHHRDRLASFYSDQANHYDSFRERLLHGRAELLQSCLRKLPDGYTWVDVGGGTGKLLEYAGEDLPRAREAVVLDLCRPLLAIAEQRAASLPNVRCVEADAEQYRPSQPVDLVTFSYSLSMMERWWQPLEQIRSWLRPGGLIGVVDFYVAAKHPHAGCRAQSWFTRTGWRTWFEFDNVYLRPDLLPFLLDHFERVSLDERRGKVPFIPFFRAPYFQFIGTAR